jgi:hypothetical protein
MTDWEELDPGPRLADRVLSRVRRKQARRIGWTVGLALLVAVAVALPMAWPSRDSGPALAQATRSPLPHPSGVANTQADVAERAEIYAAALAGLAGPHRLVQVRNEVCDAELAGPTDRCGGGLIPAAIVREVEHRLPGQVRFVAHPRSPYRSGDPAVVTFGPLDITGPRATLRRELLCGSLCGEGETLILHRLDGQWQVTGTQGPEWVS